LSRHEALRGAVLCRDVSGCCVAAESYRGILMQSATATPVHPLGRTWLRKCAQAGIQRSQRRPDPPCP
jgi:hypothetical protein